MSDVKRHFKSYEPSSGKTAEAVEEKPEVFEVVDSDINYEQAERLVQRALRRTDSATGKSGAVKRGRNYVAPKTPKISPDSVASVETTRPEVKETCKSDTIVDDKTPKSSLNKENSNTGSNANFSSMLTSKTQ